MTETPSLLSVLQALECELHQPGARADRARLDALLHSDFREFGRSGRSYERAEITASLLNEAATGSSETQTRAGDFVLRRISADAALLTYRSAHLSASGELTRHTLRSSLWVQGTNGQWQMLFHQGTPTDPT